MLAGSCSLLDCGAQTRSADEPMTNFYKSAPLDPLARLRALMSRTDAANAGTTGGIDGAGVRRRGGLEHCTIRTQGALVLQGHRLPVVSRLAQDGRPPACALRVVVIVTSASSFSCPLPPMPCKAVRSTARSEAGKQLTRSFGSCVSRRERHAARTDDGAHR